VTGIPGVAADTPVSKRNIDAAASYTTASVCRLLRNTTKARGIQALPSPGRRRVVGDCLYG
jgi:hypothetical protein